jgi:hypothetical protein
MLIGHRVESPRRLGRGALFCIALLSQFEPSAARSHSKNDGSPTGTLERIVDNLASQRVMEKLGMSFFDQANLWGMECYRYSMARAAWRPGGGLKAARVS